MNEQEIPLEKIDSVMELYSSGNIDEAILEIQSLNKEYPNTPLLFNLLGACYTSLENWEEAKENFKKAIEIKPDYADVHYNLGNIFVELDLFESAIESFHNVINIDSKYGQAYYNLGVSYYEIGQFYDAIESFQSALKLDPKNIDILLNLGNSLRELNQNIDAIYQYEKIIEIDKDNYLTYNNLATIYRSLNQIEKAIEHYKKAIEIQPNFEMAYYNLGFIYQDIGKIDKAIVQYEHAINLSNHATSFHSLSHLKKFHPNDIHVKKLKLLHSSEKLSQEERIHICLALANISESFGNQVDFFKYLNEGNSLQKKESGYSISQHEKEHKAIKKLFNQEIIPTTDSNSFVKSKKTPIFILGMPRSGTTLVEQIISSHKEVYGTGELNILTKLSKPIINNFIRGDIDKLSEKTLNFVRNEYLESLEDFGVNEKFMTDKLPLNFQYIGFILSAFPEAKIIHLERDARAVCWSNYRYYFGSKNNGYSNNFEDLASFYRLYKELMNFWNNVYPGKIYNICYEDLTENQEKETRKLLKYCELEWDQNCLNFYENTNAVKTISSRQVKKKMYQGSSDVWKKHWAYIQPLVNALEPF